MDDKIIFLDRDGVISEFTPRDYIKSWEEFKFIPAAFKGLKALTDNNYKIILISNQGGVNQGLFSEKALQEITSRMRDALRSQGIEIYGVYYCIHSPGENCGCRKPKTGLFRQAERDIGPVNFPEAFFIGDSAKDIQAGKSAGTKTILLLSGETRTSEEVRGWETKPDFIAADILEAAGIVIDAQKPLSVQSKREDKKCMM